MENMKDFKFIKRGLELNKEYKLADQPIEDEDGKFGGIYRMFLNSKNLNNLNDEDLLSLQGSQYSQSTTRKFLCRVIKLEKISPFKLQEYLEEARLVYKLINTKVKKYACGYEGVHFNDKQQVLQIFMEQRVSLHTILHSGKYGPLSSIEKSMIAIKIVKSMQVLAKCTQNAAHSHLCSKNIFVSSGSDVLNWDVLIADFGLQRLKSFCKLFNGYSNMLNNWSAPEIWEKHHKPTVIKTARSSERQIEESKSSSPLPQAYDPKCTFFHQP